jgi:hypothetical protein
MKYIYNFLVLSLALASNTVMAQEVSVDVAKNRALEFLSNQTVGSKRAKGTKSLDVTLAYTSKSADKTCFYVFNAGEDDGFVIIGGDEAAREILGYCDHGSFDYETAPANFKWWLGQYTEQIAKADKTGVTGARRAKAATNRANIANLIPSKWNQFAPYNNLVVSETKRQLGNNAPEFVTGCVATAMAQIMYKYKYPSRGIGSHTYSPANYSNLTFSANFGETTYDWSHMTDTYSSNSTSTSENAVATLMFHAGVSIDMNYNTQRNGGSSASGEYIGKTLINYFGYDKSVRNEFREYYTDEAWEKLVYDELAEGRPVLYSGRVENGGGHQFICDGYEDGLFTINWGWGGLYDGNFPLTGTGALLPEGQGAGGSDGAYTEGQMIILSVMPATSENKERPHLAQKDLSGVNSLFLTVGSKTSDGNIAYDRSNVESCKLHSTLYNISCFTTNFDYGVKAIGSNGQIYYYRSKSNQSLSYRSWGTIAFELPFDPTDWEEDTYELHPVCRVAGGSDDDWYDVTILKDETYPSITISGTAPEPTNSFDLTEEPYFNNDNNAYVEDLVLHYSIRNGMSEMSNITLYMKLVSDYYGFPYSEEIYSVLPGETVTGTVDFNKLNYGVTVTDYFTPGDTYYVYFYTDSSNSMERKDYPFVKFTYRERLEIDDYQVCKAGYGTLILPFNAELPVGMTAVYTCTGVDNNGVLTLVEEESIRRNVPYIVKADPEKGPYKFVGPEAIDADHPSFREGIMVGAVTKNVPLVANDDYILQYHDQDDEAAFYKYTGTPSSDGENDSEGNRLAKQFRAFLRPNVTTGAPSYALPGDTEEGIEFIHVDTFMPAGIYSIDGKRQNEFKKGMNVIILEDGTVQKVYVK